MRFLKLWLVLDLLCLAVLLGFSRELRLVVRSEIGGLTHGAVDITEGAFTGTWIVERLPSTPDNADWRLAWGAAECAQREQAIGDYRRAIELNPQSAALRCRLALDLASQVALDRDEFRLACPPAVEPWKTPRPATPAPSATPTAALDALWQAAQLDPDNGLLDALHAYVLFASHRDEEGMEAARRAVEKARWQDYGLEAMRVAANRAEAAGLPRCWAKAYPYESALVLYFGRLRDLTRFLTGSGRELEERGQHAQAIRHYRLAFSMAQRLRASAVRGDSVRSPGLRWLSIIQGSWRADKSEVGRYIPRERGQEGPWLELEFLDEVSFIRFLSYLESQGEKEFAWEFTAEKVAAAERQRLSDALGYPARLAMAAFTSHSLQGFSASLIPLFGMLALLAWLTRVLILRPRPQAVLALLFAVAALVAAISLEPLEVLTSGLFFVFLVLIATGISQAVAWWWTGRRSRFRASVLDWLRKVNLASIWALALAFTLFLACFIPVHVYGTQLEAYFGEILTKGEITALLGW